MKEVGGCHIFLNAGGNFEIYGQEDNLAIKLVSCISDFFFSWKLSYSCTLHYSALSLRLVANTALVSCITTSQGKEVIQGPPSLCTLIGHVCEELVVP